MKKQPIIRFTQYTFRLPSPPPARPVPISSTDACTTVDAFCSHLDMIGVQKVDMIEVSATGIKFCSRRGCQRSEAGIVDLGLYGTRATSAHVVTVIRRKHSRKDLEDMFDFVRADHLSEAKFRASLLSAAVFLETINAE